jgi:hypothetical protein
MRIWTCERPEGGGGFAGDGSVGDGFEENLVRGLQGILVRLEGDDSGDEALQNRNTISLLCKFQ